LRNESHVSENEINNSSEPNDVTNVSNRKNLDIEKEQLIPPLHIYYLRNRGSLTNKARDILTKKCSLESESYLLLWIIFLNIFYMPIIL